MGAEQGDFIGLKLMVTLLQNPGLRRAINNGIYIYGWPYD